MYDLMRNPIVHMYFIFLNKEFKTSLSILVIAFHIILVIYNFF